jgi:anaerobic selenocysteine-containing dehydrogenase
MENYELFHPFQFLMKEEDLLFAEKDGTFTSMERRVQRVRKAISPVGDSRPDWKILCDLSRIDRCEGGSERDRRKYDGWAIMARVHRAQPRAGNIARHTR